LVRNGEGGIRTLSRISAKIALLMDSGAESGALSSINNIIDPGLAALVDTWPALPETVRAGILAMVRAAGG
jgi:hypothetical protein